MAAAKVTATVGFLPMAVRIEPAVEKESSGNRTVCLGTDAEPHDPVRVEQRMTCPTCGVYHSSVHGFPHRAAEYGDKLVVIDQDDLKAAKGPAITGRNGGPLVEIKFHPREKVYGATVAGDSVQNIYPDRGGEKVYSLLRQTLKTMPDLVACMIWAPSTVNALWVLEVVGERIVATKRAWPEYVRATIAVPEVEVSPVELEMFMTFVDGETEDFDLLVYSDQALQGQKALIAERAGVAPSLPLAGGVAPGIPDLIAGLQAGIDAQKARKGTTTAKKTAAKKAPAKRAAAKKTATRKAVA